MKRTLIGTMFGTPGFYVSQPGDDLDNPQKNLILDTRFSGIEVHTAGREVLDRDPPVNNQYTFRKILSYPSLGYLPQFYLGLIDFNSNTVNYPPSMRQVGFRLSTDFSCDVTLNEIRVIITVGGANATDGISFYYVIFKAPR